ncbi:MAG: type II toxin-antitoxin system RelE/ParE family toxin [Deltaproteobacteria bacterium]|nr:type II toxin-antitoxin system RelE/ParE family toxin [Deltaproteobacteria bacterium]
MPTKAVVRISESALRDLEDIAAWYEEQGVPDVGRRLVADILARAEGLSDHPDIGRVVPEFGQPLLRELMEPPFRIVYRRDPGCVRIVRVWRSERLLKLPPKTPKAAQPR